MVINNQIKKIIWLLTVVLVVLITIFETYAWGRYVLMLVTGTILAIDFVLQGNKYKVYLDKFHIYMVTLICYAALSILWAIDISDPIIKTVTFIQILICMGTLYNYYIKQDKIEGLISVVKWSGYIISIYSLYYYGYSNVISMMFSGVRLDNEYANVNTIGMYASYSIVIQIDEFLRTKKFSWESLLCMPSFILVVATQSRKALLILIVSVVLLLILRNYNRKKLIANTLKTVFILVCFILFVRFLSDYEMFAGINKRMEYLLAMFTQQGSIGASAMVRQQLIDLGMEQFYANPIFGIGIGCPHVIANQYLRFDAYLHNGFVEILAAGGIIGFCIYYSAFAYLFYKFYKFRKLGDKNIALCLVLLLTLFFREYAMVSIYDKIIYFYLMIFFIFIKHLQVIKNHLSKDRI